MSEVATQKVSRANTTQQGGKSIVQQADNNLIKLEPSCAMLEESSSGHPTPKENVDLNAHAKMLLLILSLHLKLI